MCSGVNLAFSVTSSPSASGRGTPSPAADQASKLRFAASGSQWMFHSVVGAVLPGMR